VKFISEGEKPGSCCVDMGDLVKAIGIKGLTKILKSRAIGRMAKEDNCWNASVWSVTPFASALGDGQINYPKIYAPLNSPRPQAGGLGRAAIQ
jgi:hypothetical protein